MRTDRHQQKHHLNNIFSVTTCECSNCHTTHRHILRVWRFVPIGRAPCATENSNRLWRNQTWIDIHSLSRVIYEHTCNSSTCLQYPYHLSNHVILACKYFHLEKAKGGINVVGLVNYTRDILVFLYERYKHLFHKAYMIDLRPKWLVQ